MSTSHVDALENINLVWKNRTMPLDNLFAQDMEEYWVIHGFISFLKQNEQFNIRKIKTFIGTVAVKQETTYSENHDWEQRWQYLISQCLHPRSHQRVKKRFLSLMEGKQFH